MKISECIKQLEAIKAEFGDIAITGGCMDFDRPLSRISVTDLDGGEIYPRNVNDAPEPLKIDGVFFE